MGAAIVFDRSSDWYDALYRDKDYAAEARYVLRLLDGLCARGPVLELGCGTGRHALEFARAGREVVGVDRSRGMLSAAARLRESHAGPVRDRIELVCSAAQDVGLKRRFEAAVSLFHVLSYQVTQEDLHGFVESAARHLTAGGVFLFDFWYGPAVLFQRPETRSRKVSAGGDEVHRVAVPELDPARNLVHVHYDTYVRRAGGAAVEHVSECHSMRYFFETELRALAGELGFEALRFEEWLTGNAPGVGTWGVAGVLRRI